MTAPLRVGIVGMGGFASTHHQAVLRLEEKGLVRLVCACDPHPDQFAAERVSWRLQLRGVKVFDDYRAMLAACGPELQLLVVPTPIPLHAEMHAAAVEAGIPVYLEKPPTLDYAELDRMIARDRGAARATQVGFNFIVDKARRALKARLLQGEFGALRDVRFHGLAARPVSYFARNTWAGRLLGPDGRVILDSCLGNALAHFLHNLLHWAGTSSYCSWAEPARVQAELFRTHAIESADTFFVSVATSTGVTLRLALSHASLHSEPPVETIICERATLRYIVSHHAEVIWHDGSARERFDFEPADTLTHNYLEYIRYLRGQSDRPLTTLADCRPFVVVNDLAHLSTGEITTLPRERVEARRNPQDQKDYLLAQDLAPAQEDFLTHGVWPSARGWPRHAASHPVTPADLPRFHETIRRLHREAAP